MSRRLAALGVIVLGAMTVAFAALVAVEQFPVGLATLAGVGLALACAWYGLLRRRARRVLGVSAAAAVLAAAVALIVAEGRPGESVVVGVGGALTVGCARGALIARVRLAPAARPGRPVVFVNPRSGGGKAEQVGLVSEVRARGIEAVELTRGDDLERLAREAVDRGADVLAVAGGDGSQAVVAAVAAEHDLPYACIPAGRRNHFALDLGVDRDDVVGALDALVDGVERRVDLAEVNGRVFVNNVSLGVYAEAVQRPGYRGAKVRTLLETVPEVLGPDSAGLDLRWVEPDGERHEQGATILVSNNRYLVGHPIGPGTRPRIDDGELTVRPGALRVLVSRAHPGASPSARRPSSAHQGLGELLRIAFGRGPNRRGPRLSPRPSSRSGRPSGPISPPPHFLNEITCWIPLGRFVYAIDGSSPAGQLISWSVALARHADGSDVP